MDQGVDAEQRLRVAFVVQRYGAQVAGGSEQLCRVVAERLARRVQCDVLTTCATDYMTWQDEFANGESVLNGVTVRRFRVDQPRDVAKFNAFSERVLAGRGSAEDEEEWMRLQGPMSAPLLDYLKRSRESYDVFVFFTYLYATTCLGLPLVAERAILVPTAHDEPSIYLSLFDRLFQLPRRLLFLTGEEQEFVYRRFCLPPDSGEITGVALDPAVEGGSLPRELQAALDGNPYILYLGRVDASKGCEALIAHFLEYLEQRPGSRLRLVLAGKPVMAIPEHPRIIATGYLSEAVKEACIESSMLMAAPSPYESLCMAALEAWRKRRPVLANGECRVLVGQCRRSGGGLWYRNAAEFIECLATLESDRHLRAGLGEAGAAWVSRESSWERVEEIYMRNILAVRERSRLSHA